MRTHWGDRWIETPAPHPVPGGALVEVEASVSVMALGAVHGRSFGSPLRKTVSFAVTDGPSATLRKVRSKRAEPEYTGHYHLILAIGRVIDPGSGGEGEPGRVIALAPRAPLCASRLLVNADLVRPAGDLAAEGLGRVAAELAAADPSLVPLVRQSYLYSAMAPPGRLRDAFERAIQAAGTGEGVTASPSPAIVSPPGESTGDAGETLRIDRAAGPPGTPPLAILGAGDYVRIEVAPALAGAPLERAVIADREPQIAALAATELGFAAATTSAEAAIDSLSRRGFVVVATAHDSHAALAARALHAGHRVFCEKPAIVTPADLDLLEDALGAHPGELEVGFNRRHHPLVERARRTVAGEAGPATIVATIREVDITPEHWYLWPNQGTRVAGNLCHWIDLALHLLGPGPRALSVSVSPRVSAEPTGLDAERTFSVAFDDGSIVSLVPTGRGDSVRGVQEQVEVRRGGTTLRIDDLWRLTGLRSGMPIRRRTLWREKGHARMYAEALDRFRSGRDASYPPEDLRRVGEIQLAATELLTADSPGGEIGALLDSARARSGPGASSA